MWPARLLALTVFAWSTQGAAHDSPHGDRLPAIGAAPDFVLTSQDGDRVSLSDFRGKVVAVTFIFASCTDTCPLLTAKMAEVQDELGADFGARIAFVSITVDPERDSPGVLKEYARKFGANPVGWVFLTGRPDAISDVARRYGIFVAQQAGGDPDHTLLTSLVDPHGILRVQYLGVRFDPEEFRRDLLSILAESH